MRELIVSNKANRTLLMSLRRDRWLYLLFLPGAVFFICFKYLPMWGTLLAFKDYQPFLGFWGSPWAGLDHFRRFFSEPTFFMLLKNTLILSFLNLAFYFPLPIIVALLLNEVKVNWYKRLIQTLTYIPHFMSWVVVSSITYTMFTTEGGIVNGLIAKMSGERINFLSSTEWFRPLIVGQTIWKETGWGTIIFLAALAGVDVEMYEAAKLDGANRLQQLWNITLPSIKNTIIVMLILRIGSVMDSSFDQIFLMLNSLNRPVGEVFDTFVYRAGITGGLFSYSTAVGLFKSVIGLMLVLSADFIAKKVGEEGLL